MNNGVIIIVITKEACMNCLAIRKIGNSNGIVFPKEIMAKLKCSEGDKLYVVETMNGIELTPYDPDFAKDMALVDDIIAKNKNVLKKLAK